MLVAKKPVASFGSEKLGGSGLSPSPLKVGIPREASILSLSPSSGLSPRSIIRVDLDSSTLTRSLRSLDLQSLSLKKQVTLKPVASFGSEKIGDSGLSPSSLNVVIPREIPTLSPKIIISREASILSLSPSSGLSPRSIIRVDSDSSTLTRSLRSLDLQSLGLKKRVTFNSTVHFRVF